MNAVGSDLLRLLGSQATPGIAPGPTTAAGNAAAGALDFAKLLSQAQSGQLASGRQVTIANGANVQLTDDQIKRVSAAADLAESQGATRALVMIDGMAMKLDVSMRQVTGAVDLASQGVLTGVDAVVQVPGQGAAAASMIQRPAGIDNPTLLSVLSKQRS